MTNPHGTPIWYELLAGDADVAERFYSHVVGWTIASSGMVDGLDYRILTAPDGDAIGGLMPLPADAPMRPGWLFYVGVDDVDAMVERATALGGAVNMPAMDVPGVGRMALLADPQGVPFYVMRGASDEASRSFRDGDAATPGHAVWNELTAADQDAALAFYADLFGWRHEGAMPMGPMGDYKFVLHGTSTIGASMNAFEGARPGWQFYFDVDDVDAAVTRLGEAGGRAVQGPDQIPGGTYAVVAEDDAGARFGFVGPRV